MSRGSFRKWIPHSEGWTFWSNNAGAFRFGAFTDISVQVFDVHYNINVLGMILTVQEAIKRFGPDGGSIINLSSIVGSHPVPGALLYASTKGAIETLNRGLAIELAPRKIRVNATAPGHTETEGNVAAGTFEGSAGAPLKPLALGRVTDIAPLAVFLASDESAWITGEVIRAAGGLICGQMSAIGTAEKPEGYRAERGCSRYGGIQLRTN